MFCSSSAQWLKEGQDEEKETRQFLQQLIYQALFVMAGAASACSDRDAWGWSQSDRGSIVAAHVKVRKPLGLLVSFSFFGHSALEGVCQAL